MNRPSSDYLNHGAMKLHELVSMVRDLGQVPAEEAVKHLWKSRRLRITAGEVWSIQWFLGWVGRSNLASERKN